MDELERLQAKRARWLNLAKTAHESPDDPISQAMARASLRKAIQVEGQIDRLLADRDNHKEESNG